MSAPRSILKKPAANARAGPSRPKQGSKLKQTVAVAQSARPAKAKKSRRDEDEDEDMASASEGDDDMDNDFGDGGDEDDEPDTDDEIARTHTKEPKKQPKRKVATTAETFGSTLTSLLSESSQPPRPQKRSKTDEEPKARKAPAKAPILSLSKAVMPPSKNTLSLERKAALALKHEKQEREDRARVKDVVEGWTHEGTGLGGMEFERQLRKTAQRGVIKLFNAILIASKNSDAADLPLAVRAGVKPEKGKRSEKDNVLGRGGREELTKESFLDLVRKGGK